MQASIPIPVFFIGWALWAGGSSLLVGRLMHAAILSKGCRNDPAEQDKVQPFSSGVETP